MGEAVSVGVTDVQVEAIEAPRGGTPSVPTLNHFLTFKYVQRSFNAYLDTCEQVDKCIQMLRVEFFISSIC